MKNKIKEHTLQLVRNKMKSFDGKAFLSSATYYRSNVDCDLATEIIDYELQCTGSFQDLYQDTCGEATMLLIQDEEWLNSFEEELTEDEKFEYAHESLSDGFYYTGFINNLYAAAYDTIHFDEELASNAVKGYNVIDTDTVEITIFEINFQIIFDNELLNDDEYAFGTPNDYDEILLPFKLKNMDNNEEAEIYIEVTDSVKVEWHDTLDDITDIGWTLWQSIEWDITNELGSIIEDAFSHKYQIKQ